MQNKSYSIFSLPVTVGALGFFVDIYDLLVFSFVRIASFKSLHIPEELHQKLGEDILSWQMIGLVIGGIIWGILGDKKGRKSVLFGSIILYSLATLATSFVTDANTYLILRFIAGLGLAGELGASITLTSEILPKEKRGLAATVIATCGVLGSITAYLVFTNSNNNWQLCYRIGGIMGLMLLLLRVKVLDSTMYDKAKTDSIQMGNYLMFFNNKKRFITFIKCIAIGLPVWFVIGTIISFSNEYAKRFGIVGFDQPKALMYQYVGLAFGDLFAGILSNILKSRKKALLVYYAILAVVINSFFYFKAGESINSMYTFCVLLGFGSGISVLYITMSAENFGTNLRASAAISIPNLVRGCLPLITMLFRYLRQDDGILHFKDNYIAAAWIIGIIILLLGFIAAIKTKETYSDEMDFVEH